MSARVRPITCRLPTLQRLINGCDDEFRPLVRAALETGCRYSGMTRLVVSDFNRDSGTLHIRKSKSGKERHVILTDEGAAFFKAHCAGLSGSALMFTHADGEPWKTAQQGRPMREACDRAKTQADQHSRDAAYLGVVMRS